jgi:hypothetical protein
VPTIARIARRSAQIAAVSVDAAAIPLLGVIPNSSVVADILAAFSAALFAGASI